MMDFKVTETGLGSGGLYSVPETPVCAGCEKPIDETPIWECGVQWHAECLPSHPMIDPLEAA